MKTQLQGSALRVLVVDDDADIVRSTAILLRYLGFEVQTALSGLAALQAVGERWPDVILMDIGLPQMNGYEVAKRIREQCGARKKPFLMAVSGYDKEVDCLRSEAQCFDCYLIKPVEISDVAERLAALQMGLEVGGAGRPAGHASTL